MELFIDTTERGRMVLGLIRDDGLIRKEYKVEKLSESLLLLLQIFLQRNKTKLSDLKRISVNAGPGGFSSTRTGVATANALAFALRVPVATWPGGKPKEMVLPKYDREPNITKPKKFPNDTR